MMFSPSGRTRRVTSPILSADVIKFDFNVDESNSDGQMDESSAKRSVAQRTKSCPTVSYPEVRRKNTLVNGGFWKTLLNEKEFWNDGRWFFDDPFFRMYST